MIDTHCHLYSLEFENDIEEVMQRAKAQGVNKFYLPAIDSEYTDRMDFMEEKYPNICLSMAGLHPCSVKEDYQEELEKIKDLLQKRIFSGIGETGLDFYWDKTFITQQYDALERQIALALKYHLPLILHTRNATQETIDVIKKYSDTELTGIFHCFGGSLKEAEQIIDLNFFLGIGGVVTYKNAGLAEVLENIHIKNIVLETDAPYLSPVPKRGKRNEPAYLQYIVDKLALVKNLTVDEVISETTINAEKIFAS